MTTLPIIDAKATGQKITEKRKKAGYTVRQLQKRLGFTNPQAIYKWQRGDSVPCIDNLVALSVILKVKIDDIVVYRMPGSDE